MSKFWLFETDWSGYDFTSLLNRLLGFAETVTQQKHAMHGFSLMLGVDVSVSQLPWGMNSHWSLLAYSGCRMWHSIVLIRAYFQTACPSLFCEKYLLCWAWDIHWDPHMWGWGSGSSLSVWLFSVTFAKLLTYPIVAGRNKTIQRQEHSIMPWVGQHLVFQWNKDCFTVPIARAPVIRMGPGLLHGNSLFTAVGSDPCGCSPRETLSSFVTSPPPSAL